MTAKKVPRPVYFPVAENLTKKDFPVTINVQRQNNWHKHRRHLAEWR